MTQCCIKEVWQRIKKLSCKINQLFGPAVIIEQGILSNDSTKHAEYCKNIMAEQTLEIQLGEVNQYKLINILIIWSTD